MIECVTIFMSLCPSHQRIIWHYVYRIWRMHKLLQAAQALIHCDNRYWTIIRSLCYQIANHLLSKNYYQDILKFQLQAHPSLKTHTNVVRSALLYKSGYKRRHVWTLYSRMKHLWIIQRLWELAKYNFRMFTGAGRREGRRHELPAPLDSINSAGIYLAS